MGLLHRPRAALALAGSTLAVQRCHARAARLGNMLPRRVQRYATRVLLARYVHAPGIDSLENSNVYLSARSLLICLPFSAMFFALILSVQRSTRQSGLLQLPRRSIRWLDGSYGAMESFALHAEGCYVSAPHFKSSTLFRRDCLGVRGLRGGPVPRHRGLELMQGL